MSANRVLATLSLAFLAVPLFLAPVGPAAASAAGRVAVGLRADAAQQAPDLELIYTARTSDTDSCTGECDEGGLGLADWSSYTRKATGKLSSQVKFSVFNGDTTPGTGVLTETATWKAAGGFTDMAVSKCDQPGDGSGTEDLSGGVTPGGLEVFSLTAVRDADGKPDLQLEAYEKGEPAEHTLVTTTGTCPASFPYEEITASEDIQDVDIARRVADPYISGWTINRDWKPGDGTLATRTMTGSVPQPTTTGPDTGTQQAAQTWKLVTCPDASTVRETIVCVADLAVDGMPLPGWDGGPIPYSWGGGHDADKAGPSTGTCKDYTGPDEDHCETYKKGPLFTVGLDCSGFTRWVYYFAYGSDVLGDGGNNDQRIHPGVHEVKTAEPGDLVFFKNKKDKWIHVGIVVSPGMMAHEPHTGASAQISAISKNPHYYAFSEA
jgi:hypothetical protein